MAIQGFGNRETERFYTEGRIPRRWRAIAQDALDKLEILDAAVELRDLERPHSNRLHGLSGNYQGYHAINVQPAGPWRIIFRWTPSGPEDVEITDYH